MLSTYQPLITGFPFTKCLKATPQSGKTMACATWQPDFNPSSPNSQLNDFGQVIGLPEHQFPNLENGMDKTFNGAE